MTLYHFATNADCSRRGASASDTDYTRVQITDGQRDRAIEYAFARGGPEKIDVTLDEYQREQRDRYERLAETIAAVLTDAIAVEGGYRLQQVASRAKEPASLRRKLEKQGIDPTLDLENLVKDLAGCRVIFYTDGDVNRFLHSAIITSNFDVLELKVHHPSRVINDATELYASNHFIVRLQPERTALPEYARFAGMRCEIQVQTILNHAWSEMAHDTIYKAPVLGSFGARSFEDIKARMQKVARKYLMPAGYEFQQIASDFTRLIEGKTLFDREPLDAIVGAMDNNARAEAIERFAEYVLPHYEDLGAIYPEIVERLVEAADRSRETRPVAIDTPDGMLAPKQSVEIVKAIADILTRYRYVDRATTFSGLRRLYGRAASEEERNALLDAGKALAKHDLQIWRQYGPAVQAELVDLIETLPSDQCKHLHRLLTVMLGAVLGTEVKGTTNTSSQVTLFNGPVTASEMLRGVRTKAIELLKRQFRLSETDEDRDGVLRELDATLHLPMRGGYSNALALIMLEDTRDILRFEAQVAAGLTLEPLRMAEIRVHRRFVTYADLPADMRDDRDLVAIRDQVERAALAFRDAANGNQDYVIYKTLVGYNSVLQPAWDDSEFYFKQPEAYRAQQIDALLHSVDDASAHDWFDRLSRYAQTKSDDLADFIEFGRFLQRLGEQQPGVILDYIGRVEGPLDRFLADMVAGVMRSPLREQAVKQIRALLRDGKYLGQLAHYLRNAEQFDETMLQLTFRSAVDHDDRGAVRRVLIAAAQQYPAHPGSLIEKVFIPAMRFLVERRDIGWLNMPWVSWLESPILLALDESQAEDVLDALVRGPTWERETEHLIASIAKRWPGTVLAFLSRRQAFAQTEEASRSYRALPYTVYELKEPLAAVPDLMLDAARAWFDTEPTFFRYDGAKLLASVFPELSHGLAERLAILIASGDEQHLRFVLAVLCGFEGRPCVYGLVHDVVAAADAQSELVRDARYVLDETGVVVGEFGYAELYTQRKALLAPWLTDTSAAVKAFATEQTRNLDQRIAAETRSADASIAMRKLRYGEDIAETGDDQEE